MAGEIDRAKLLDQFIAGIDYIIEKSEPFGSAFGNQLRTLLFNARTTVETLKLDQVNAPSADEVQAGTPASGAMPAQNFAGTGADPIVTAGAEPTTKTEDPAETPGAPIANPQKPDDVSQAAWDLFTPEQRAQLINHGHVPLDPATTADAVPHAPEDDPAATQQAAPWEGSPDA